MGWQVVEASLAAAWFMNQLTPVKGAADADWNGNSLSCCVPPGYPTYLKLFHTILEDLSIHDKNVTWDEWDRAQAKPATRSATEERIEHVLSGATLSYAQPQGDFPSRRVLWRDLAARYGLKCHAEFNNTSLSRRFRNRSWPRHLIGPSEGTLTPEEFRSLVECIVQTDEAEDLYFLWHLPRVVRGQHPYCVRGRFPDSTIPWPESIELTPEYIWPESRAWIVHSDYDSTHTIVAASEALAVEILRSTELEALVVPFGTRIDSGADRINV